MSFRPSSLCTVAATGQTTLARRVLALLTRQRLVETCGLVERTAEVAVDAEPVHLAVAAHLLLATTGTLFSALTGDHAGVAAGARPEVDRHAPLRAGVECLRRIEQMGLSSFRCSISLAKAGRGLELVERRRANDVAALDRPVILRAHELIGVAGRRGCRRRQTTARALPRSTYTLTPVALPTRPAGKRP